MFGLYHNEVLVSTDRNKSNLMKAGLFLPSPDADNRISIIRIK